MIFVSVGSSTIPFDRLLRAVDCLTVDERLVVQHGASSIRPQRADCVDYVAFDEFVGLVREARVVVTHAGAGSTLTALAQQKRPIVIPRLTAFDEAVDDHQLPFARRAGELGLVTLVEDVDDLAAAIAEHSSDSALHGSGRGAIEIELRSYLEENIGPVDRLVLSEGREA
jgi:UDP-N-acetylglucosamine transferase subunit ALG13